MLSGVKVVAQALTDGDPRSLGVFQLLGRLGEGGQGIVYLGRSPSGEQVAIKLLHARLASEPEARSRFLREVSVAQRVARFCTAPVLHADLEGSQPYVVSEYVAGPSLRELVESEGPRRGAALDRLAISTATALAAIHRAGILHRDFKPANVLIGPEGPVVIDFGIARALDTPSATMTGSAMGTPSYLAPELLSGGAVTPAVDIFAWGITMVFAATARPAFGNDSIPLVMNRILHEEPDLASMDHPLRDLVAACLSKDPTRRPTAEQLLTHLTGQPLAPPPPRPVRPAPPAPRNLPRRRTLTLAAAGGVVALALATGTVVFAQSREPETKTVAAEQAPAPVATTPAASAPGTSAPTTTHTRRPGKSPDASSVDLPVGRASHHPTGGPVDGPTGKPRPHASRKPTAMPTSAPSAPAAPTVKPTVKPTVQPTVKPTVKPTVQPTVKPTVKPTVAPTVKPTVAPKANPYTATGVCGSGYKVVDSHGYGSATTYLLYSSGAGKNCVITLSRYVVPGKIRMSAVLQVQGGSSASDTGSYTAYAGPLRLSAVKKCVIWGGGYGTATWKSSWSHCG